MAAKSTVIDGGRRLDGYVDWLFGDLYLGDKVKTIVNEKKYASILYAILRMRSTDTLKLLNLTHTEERSFDFEKPVKEE